MVRVDTSNFNGFCREIARTKGLGLKVWDVMLYEVGKVLEGCVRLTTREKVEQIRRSIEFKNRTLRFGDKGSGPAIIYVTKSGVIWFADEPGAGNEGIAKGRTSAGKTFHPMTEFFRYGQPRWDRYQRFLAQLKDKQIDVRMTVGRAAQSWVQIAEGLGMQVNAPDYVRNAPPFRQVRHVNGRARKTNTADGLFLEMKNFAPILLGTMDGNKILQTSINGRYSYFRNGMKRGVFEDVAKVARQYPGLIVRAT